MRTLALHDGALLADDMGLGKTVQALLALPPTAGVVVVAPACVKHNWRTETTRWRPDLKVAVLEGRGSFRWPAPGEMVILNPDILPGTARKDGKRTVVDGLPPKPDHECILIADEAHLYKSHTAARSARMKALATAADRRWALTGTPLLGRPFDLYGLLGSFDLDRDVFGGWFGFLRLFGGHKGQWGGYEFDGPTGPEAAERLRRVSLRRTKAEVLPDLPGKTRTTLTVNGMDRATEKALDDALEEWHEVIAGELPPFSAFSALRAQLATSRIPALVELVEGYEDAETPLVVFSAHRAPVDALEAREGWATITGDTSGAERQAVVERFQAGQLRGVALTIAAGGVGLTLTRASTMVFVDLDWTPALNLQAEDRICRIGQKAEGCNYVVMQSDHVLDLHVGALLGEKMALIERAVEAVGAATTYGPSGPGLRDDAEAAARVAAIEAATAKAEHDGAAAKTRRYLVERGGEIEVRDLTPDEREAVEDGLAFMLSVCDGAEMRDGEGFNKPDACRSRWFAVLGLEDREAAYACYLMLRGYHRQLGDRFPIIFDGVA